MFAVAVKNPALAATTPVTASLVLCHDIHIRRRRRVNLETVGPLAVVRQEAGLRNGEIVHGNSFLICFRKGLFRFL